MNFKNNIFLRNQRKMADKYINIYQIYIFEKIYKKHDYKVNNKKFAAFIENNF